jgi:hypothetical protein
MSAGHCGHINIRDILSYWMCGSGIEPNLRIQELTPVTNVAVRQCYAADSGVCRGSRHINTQHHRSDIAITEMQNGHTHTQNVGSLTSYNSVGLQGLLWV